MSNYVKLLLYYFNLGLVYYGGSLCVKTRFVSCQPLQNLLENNSLMKINYHVLLSFIYL